MSTHRERVCVCVCVCVCVRERESERERDLFSDLFGRDIGLSLSCARVDTVIVSTPKTHSWLGQTQRGRNLFPKFLFMQKFRPFIYALALVETLRAALVETLYTLQ